MDFLRFDSDRPLSFAQNGTHLIPAVSRLGPSLDDAPPFGGRRGSDRQLVDGAASALHAGLGGDSGRRSVLLPLAQADWDFSGKQQTKLACADWLAEDDFARWFVRFFLLT